jgi:flavorubredoxin
MLEIDSLKKNEPSLESPILIYNEPNHKIYWLGIVEDSAFRCNVYLIHSGDDLIIVDPGDRASFEDIKSKVDQVANSRDITALILCHQDPDVAASMVDWLELKPTIQIITSTRTQVLLPYYGISDYDFYDIVQNPIMKLSSGKELKFIEAPFLHFPGAFVTYDIASKALFSGDIWAALDIEWKLIIDDFESHIMALDLFHKDYMASNIATRGFTTRLHDEIDVILPQHGSIIPKELVDDAIKYLKELKCGVDLIYPELTNG